MNRICQACGKNFRVSPCRVRKGGGKYCRHECYFSTKPRQVEKICEVCGKKFTVQYYRRDAKFCSSKCYGGFQQGQYRGGISKTKAYRSKFQKRWLLEPKNKLRVRMTNAIGASLRDNKPGRFWEKLVGYTLQELKMHLENQFLPGMNWQNYGKWHVDHIKPVKIFNFRKPEDADFKKCWALENLQPLWANKNVQKSARLSSGVRL